MVGEHFTPASSTLATRVGALTGAETLAASLARFGAVGVVVAALNYAAYLLLLLWMGLPYLQAVVLGWLICLGPAFVLNRRMTFLVRGQASRREIGRYLATYVFQFVLALSGLVVLIDGLRVPAALAFPVNVVLVSVSNFMLLRFFVYPLQRARQ